MKRAFCTLLLGLFGVVSAGAAPVIFRDDFRSSLAEGWRWVREDPEGWRVKGGALEIRAQPGNMWGEANNARNVLVRAAPDTSEGAVEVSVVVENRPTEQFEQANLVWYYDDSHMVKLGQELVDGQLSIVMGREESDRAQTLAVIPNEAYRVHLRFRVRGDRIRGQFRSAGDAEWRDAGSCDLPVNGAPKVSLQTYQGPDREERWVRFTEFRIRRLSEGG